MRVLLTLLLIALFAQAPASPRAGDPLPPWTPGTLDIHQISTGRGNAAFSILPDGTTLLVDAGASDAAGADPRPDGSRTPGEWIVHYIERTLAGRPRRIDYAVLTHFHPDHIGQITGNERASADGFLLSGITEVAE
jgi:glyoxylase-like metal-dependent hydrolase (beta-lactamase superfamily II)